MSAFLFSFPAFKKPLEYTHSNKQHPFAIRTMYDETPKDQMSNSLKEPSSEKTFRKYFGKKVTNLLYLKKGPSFNVGYRCKILKKVQIYSQFPADQSLKYIRTLHIFDSLPWIFIPSEIVNLPQFLPRITDYKYLHCLKIESRFEDLSIKPLRTLRNLQFLSLRIHGAHFDKNYNFLLQIKSFKGLELSLFDRCDPDQSALSDFFEKISSSLEKLEFLGLKLQEFFDKVGQDCQFKFLECLRKTKILSFDIELISTETSPIDIDHFQACLSNVDLVHLQIANQAVISVALGEDNLICQSAEEARRKLHVTFWSDAFSENEKTEAVVESSDLLNKLKIVCHEILSVPFPLSGFSKISDLKRFGINLRRIKKKIVPEVSNIFLELLGSAKNLENLSLTLFNKDMGDRIGEYDVYQAFSKIVNTSGLPNLSTLDLTGIITKGNFLNILCEMLALKNLERLRLVVTIQEQDLAATQPKNSLIDFKNSKLSVLECRLSDIREESVPEFIKIILGLKELQDICITEAEQLTKTENNYFLLMEGFKQLKKLKYVSIFGAERKNSGMFATLGNNITTQNSEDSMVPRMRNVVKKLFDNNVNLQKIHLDLPSDKVQYHRHV